MSIESFKILKKLSVSFSTKAMFCPDAAQVIRMNKMMICDFIF